MSSKIVRKLIDIGANLTDPMFRGVYHASQRHPSDFNNMIARAKESGVHKIIITGGTLQESKEALSLAQQDPSFFSTVGCHPTRCNEFNDYEQGPESYLDQLKQLASNNKNKIVALGEIGLDYDRLHFCDKDVQMKYFNLQLDLAQELCLPLFLHNRNSIDDFIDILQQNRHKFDTKGGVVHSFDGTMSDLQRILDLNLYIGINGCSLKTEENLEVVKLIPKDRLMIETDCPWCEIKRTHASFKHVTTVAVTSKDGKDSGKPVKNRNEPSRLLEVLEVLASVRGDNIDELEEQIYLNTNKLFFQQ